MSAKRVFDLEHYESLNQARSETVTRLLVEIRDKFQPRTVVDVGCGLGYFSGLLSSLGMKVTGIDGRKDNVEEAKVRYPDVRFEQFDAQDPKIAGLGKFDLVFCFGLLYHLENPLLTMRNLQAMTVGMLLVESVTFPGNEPIMALVDEEQYEDQGLRYVAFYPTEACLIKMMYRSDFSHVYKLRKAPEHPEYHSRRGARRVRTMLAAMFGPVASESLVIAPEPATDIRPWDPRSGSTSFGSLLRMGKDFR